MERWGLDMAKEYFKFSAAHFLIFPDGSAERLHGHNYHVTVELDAGLDEFGLVLDFKKVKPVVRELCDWLDEHFLVPGLHAELEVGDVVDGHRTVVYRDTRYMVPDEDLIVLPINVDATADALADARSFIDVHEPLPLYSDIRFQLPFEFPGKGKMPQTVFLDREGRIRAIFAGEADWNSPEAHALIDALLAEGAPAA